MKPENEKELINQIALMFFDARTVNSIAADYALAVIKMVRDFDARQLSIVGDKDAITSRN